MPQLKELSLRYATPVAPHGDPRISRTVTLPSLTHFHIDEYRARDCAFALAHLVLPNLTQLHVDLRSGNEEGEDVRLVIPYVAQKAYVLQDIEPIRSILIAGEETHAEIYAWATPGADVEICDMETLIDMSRSASLIFYARGTKWRNGVDTAIFDALLTILSVKSVLTLTAHNRARLSKEFWISHASRLRLLEQARLVTTSVEAFLKMLAEDTPPDGPRLPSLTRLILLDVRLTSHRTYHLGDILIERVEQGVPLEVLDLRMCIAADLAIQFLAEIVVDVQEPLDARQTALEKFFKYVEIKYRYEVEYDDWREPWRGDIDYGNDSEYEDEYEDEEEDEDEDEDENEDGDEEEED